MLRRLPILLAVGVLAAVFGPSALAARPGGWVHTATSQHFAVHYTSDPQDAAYATQKQATALAAYGEEALAAETGWGAPSPVDDGDGKTDVYIQDLSALDGVEAYAQADTNAASTSGYIVYGVAYLDVPHESQIIAHELFHLLQYATWANGAASDRWLYEASAEWASAKVLGFPEWLAGAVPNQISLDCRDSVDGFQKCDSAPYDDGGYSRWPFFQALAGRFGPSFVGTVFTQGATGMTAVAALQAAITAKGATLADVYNDWVVQQMTDNYGISSLDATKPATVATVSTGVSTASLAPVTTRVDHLAAAFVKFTRGDGAADHACYAATLTVKVTIPSGVTSRPYFFWSQKGNAAVPLAIAGSTASVSVPWDTCLWPANAGYLALPNDTTTVDAADFVVSSSLVVDPNTPASASAPASQGTIYGGQTNVSNADVAPAISLFGPLLIQVPASAPLLRLIVESTDAGKVHATLGSVDLGTVGVRAGNNDLRFTLPKSLLASLRRSSAAGSNVLSLTPVSPSGSTTGQPVTRQIAVVAAKKTTKHKTKRP